MHRYIVRRLLLFIPTLAMVSVAIFVLLRILPGDVATVILAGPGGDGAYTQADVQRLKRQIGLDKPIHIQYVDWVSGMVRGDLGNSAVLNRPIIPELQRQFPVTLQLGALSLLLVFGTSIPIGILAAVRQDSWIDYLLRGVAILGLAMPGFFAALLVILVLSRVFNWIPPIGFVNLWNNPAVSFQQLIFAALALGFTSAGTLVRIMRTQLLEVLREDYVRTGRAKGLSERIVILRHAVRNATLPVVTIAGFHIGVLFSGAVVVELIFNLPGVGRGLVQALQNRDLPVIQVYVMYFALISLSANLLVDLLYAWLDPRIRYA